MFSGLRRLLEAKPVAEFRYGVTKGWGGREGSERNETR